MTDEIEQNLSNSSVTFKGFSSKAEKRRLFHSRKVIAVARPVRLLPSMNGCSLMMKYM